MKAAREFISGYELRWKYIVPLIIWETLGVYGCFSFPYLQKKMTFLWLIFTFVLYILGVTCGAHRLWAHRCYKATVPLRLILAFWFYGSGMLTLFEWVRVHRVHHKYSDTNADPHNSTRGFFFSHIGWLFIEKNEECLEKLREVDMSDIKADPVVQFGDKYYIIVTPLIAFIIPAIVPVYFWNESWYWAIMSQFFMRYTLTLNAASSVNSFAHMWGSKPYDRNICPVENNSANFITLGEGSHNYHHTFPWDYKAAEFGNGRANLSTFVIKQFAKIGWAYDLKEPSEDLIRMTYQNRGDGSHPEL